MATIPILERPKKTTATTRFEKYEIMDMHGNFITVEGNFETKFHDPVEIPLDPIHNYRYFIGWNDSGNALIQRVMRNEPENDL